MENTTQKENELIGNTDKFKPEQMESGKWYVIETLYFWIIKFKNINNQNVNVYKAICTDSFVKYKYEDFNQCKIQHIKSIRHATNEEVLKYYPDEKFEQQNQIEPEKVEVDWKSKFEELQKRYEVLVTESHKLDVLSGEMCDKYTALKASYERLSIYNDELTEKINETETKNNQEKVYIHYNSKKEKWLQADTLELALLQSEENKNIYEAVKIGVKKSILVSE